MLPELSHGFRLTSHWKEEEEGETVWVDTTFQHMRMREKIQDIEFTKWRICHTDAALYYWRPLFSNFKIIFFNLKFISSDFNIYKFLYHIGKDS